MNEMVERVALAVFKKEQEIRLRSIEQAVIGKARYYLIAEAAIAAMREPTEAMRTAGELHGIDSDCKLECSELNVWQAMIDEALKE
jgi:hypothetical protein